MNRSSWWAYALHRPLGGRIISLGANTVLHLQNPQKATSLLWLKTNFAETRLAEVRILGILGSSPKVFQRSLIWVIRPVPMLATVVELYGFGWCPSPRPSLRKLSRNIVPGTQERGQA